MRGPQLRLWASLILKSTIYLAEASPRPELGSQSASNATAVGFPTGTSFPILNPASNQSASAADKTCKAAQKVVPASGSQQSTARSQPAMLPAVHWECDKNNMANLVPANSHDLYYSSSGGDADASLEHAFAYLTTTISHPSVVLEHSSFIQTIQCNAKDLVLHFTNVASLAYAQNAWSTLGNFMVITHQPDCGSTTGDQRSFWLVSGVLEGGCDTCLTLAVEQEVGAQQAIQGVDMSWGTYKPTPGSSSPPASGTGAGGGSSNTGTGTTPTGSSQPSSTAGGGSSNTGTGTTPTGSSQPSSTSTCGQPPAPKIDGFPAAECGSATFDEDLDNQIGYLQFDGGDYGASVKNFAPGLGDDSEANDEGFEPSRLVRRRGRLQRRGWFLDRIVAQVKSTASAIRSAITKVGEGIVKGVETVGHAVSNALAVSPNVDLNVPINVAPNNLVDSPWGQALQIYKKEKSSESGNANGEISLYCVQCGVNGNIHLSGQAKWTLLDGLQQANVGMSGNVAAGVELGIDAQASLSQTFTYPIAQVGVPGFSIPQIITVGPEIALSAEVELGVSLAGQVLAGVRMTIPNFQANLDLVDGSKSGSSGFTPQFEKIFEAKAEITATAGLGLPLSVAVGIDIPAIKWKKTASINEKPAVEATLRYTASTTCEGITEGNTCVNGIRYDIEFKNDVYADLFGLKKYDLFKFAAPISGDCLHVGPQCTPGSTNNTESSSASAPGSANNTESSSASAPAPTTSPNGTTDSTGAGTTDTNPADESPSVTKRQVDGNNDTFSYVDSQDETSAPDDSTFEALSTAALAEADSQPDTTNGTSVHDPPDTHFINILSMTGSYSLISDFDTGKLLVGTASDATPWAAVDGVVAGDEEGRFLHYYPDTMSAYNVSRILLSAQNHIPVTADIIALVPLNTDNDAATQNLYAAVDTLGNVFVTITCDIEGQDSRVFLAKGAEEGLKMLEEERLRYTITGGVVTACYYLPFVAPVGTVAVA